MFKMFSVFRSKDFLRGTNAVLYILEKFAIGIGAIVAQVQT